MIIKKNDKSILRYEMKKHTEPLEFKEKGFYPTLRARHRLMYLHGRILTEENELVEVRTDHYLMPIYTLYIEEVVDGKVIRDIEILCGVTAQDPIEAWKVLRRQGGKLDLSQAEQTLLYAGYPNPDDFDRKCKSGLNNYARYQNMISRRNYKGNIVEIIDAKEVIK